MSAIAFNSVWANRLAARMPRRSIRLRLTLLYGALFLGSGAAMLIITYLIVAHTTSGNGVVVSYTGTGKLPDVPPYELGQWGKSQIVAQHAQMMRQLLWVSGLSLIGMALISVLLGWWMAGRALRPVREMTGKARRLSEANLHERLAVTGPDDEIKELGDTFDGLLARLDAAFEAQRRFVANASHELRTPLTFQRAALEVVLADEQADAAQLRRVCERVLAAGEEQERLIEALLTLARSQRGLERRQPVDLAALTERVVAERAPAGVARTSKTEPVSVHCVHAASWTAGDARLLERLVGNLVDNAIRHNVPGGWVTVWTGTDRDRDRAMLRVANSGPPIPAERIGELVQPFQRLDARTGTRDGLGLGLSIVAAIAGAHGAHLGIEARGDGGLDITLALPAATPPPIPHRAARADRAEAVTGISVM